MATDTPLNPESAPPPETTLADDTPDGDEDLGRIGYGVYGKWTPIALAAILVLVLLAIGIYRSGWRSQPSGPARLVGQAAPDFNLQLLNGQTLRLSDLRGDIVVVNFWASWCDPCRLEAPVLEAASKSSDTQGKTVIIVGVGLKNDTTHDAQTFVKQLGLTYDIGRDTGGKDPVHGPIELAYRVDPSRYPETFFIRPDGSVAAVHLGQIDAKQLQAGIGKAGA